MHAFDTSEFSMSIFDNQNFNSVIFNMMMKAFKYDLSNLKANIQSHSCIY